MANTKTKRQLIRNKRENSDSRRVTVSYSLKPELIEAIRINAADRGTTASHLVEELLSQELLDE